MENRCVVCGAIIPEGRQVCPNCMEGFVPEQEQTINVGSTNMTVNDIITELQKSQRVNDAAQSVYVEMLSTAIWKKQ